MKHISISIFSILLVSIYSLQITDIDGISIPMSNFQGKKILLINIASGSNKVNQLHELRTLQQQYADSLVIIAFPSNSFNNEPFINAEIKNFCDTGYQSNFIITSKCSVSGSTAHPIFQWLASKNANGDIDAPAQADFQKFLIDENGKVISVLSPKIRPMDPDMVNAITGNE
jgi:glutathione peroxidase